DVPHVLPRRRHVDLPALGRQLRIVPVAPPDSGADEPGPGLLVQLREEVILSWPVVDVDRVVEERVVPGEKESVDPAVVAHCYLPILSVTGDYFLSSDWRVGR